MQTHFKLLASGLLAAVLLTACGGGGDDVVPPAPDVPDEALASSEGYTEWAKGLQPSDSNEPLNMDRLVMAPSSETAEPASLD
jgi:hypothetical protein